MTSFTEDRRSIVCRLFYSSIFEDVCHRVNTAASLINSLTYLSALSLVPPAPGSQRSGARVSAGCCLAGGVVAGRDYVQLLGATKPAPPQQLSQCHAQPEPFAPCLCRYDVCVGWYPCGLKYCRGKDSAGAVVSYRCGIKTCRRCRRFDHAAQRRSLCVWDEPEVKSVALERLREQMLL